MGECHEKCRAKCLANCMLRRGVGGRVEGGEEGRRGAELWQPEGGHGKRGKQISAQRRYHVGDRRTTGRCVMLIVALSAACVHAGRQERWSLAEQP